jgi:hypothetical protein
LLKKKKPSSPLPATGLSNGVKAGKEATKTPFPAFKIVLQKVIISLFIYPVRKFSTECRNNTD